jgi:hypothetical protein
MKFLTLYVGFNLLNTIHIILFRLSNIQLKCLKYHLFNCFLYWQITCLCNGNEKKNCDVFLVKQIHFIISYCWSNTPSIGTSARFILKFREKNYSKSKCLISKQNYNRFTRTFFFLIFNNWMKNKNVVFKFFN